MISMPGRVHNTATAAYTYAGEDYSEEDEVTVRLFRARPDNYQNSN